MKRSALTIHEKAFNRAKSAADQHMAKFRTMESDISLAINELNGVVDAIDAEMDKLADLRIKTQQQIKGHQTVLAHLSDVLGGFKHADR